MRADPRAPRPGAAVTTLVSALVPVTGRLRLPAVMSRMLFPKFLNAAWGSNLGCATYLHIRRLLPAANMEVSQ
jgi:hypothetical protein